MKPIYILFLFFGLLTSCNKKIIVPLDCDCTTNYTAKSLDTFPAIYDTCNYMPDINFHLKYGYTHAQFNPKNGNQIAYMRPQRIPMSYDNELWTFDFCTGEKKMLTNKILSPFDWSANGWLLYMDWDKQLYKIKSNGDSLTQLTFSGIYNTKPSWNPDGTAFYFVKEEPGIRRSYLAKPNGEIYKDLGREIIGRSAVHWDMEDYLLVHKDKQISLFEIKTLNNELFDTLQNLFIDITGPLHYLKNRNGILWTSGYKMGIIELDTKQEDRFFETPWDGSNNIVIDVSSDEKTVLISRVNRLKTGQCERQVEEALYFIDIDGKNERRILIPE